MYSHRRHLSNGCKHQQVTHPDNEVSPNKSCKTPIQQAEFDCTRPFLMSPADCVVLELDVRKRELPCTHCRTGECENGKKTEISLDSCQSTRFCTRWTVLTFSCCVFPNVRISCSSCSVPLTSAVLRSSCSSGLPWLSRYEMRVSLPLLSRSILAAQTDSPSKYKIGKPGGSEK